MKTYIKLARCISEKKVFNNPNWLKVFIWCLIKARHRDESKFIAGQEIKKGQFMFGRKSAAKELKMHESTVYRGIRFLQKNNSISIKSNNRYSIITVVNYDTYQDVKTYGEQQANNKRTTSEHKQECKRMIKKKNIVDFLPSTSDFDFPAKKELPGIVFSSSSVLPKRGGNPGALLQKDYADLDFFECLWKQYPRKDGKKSALRHFKASVKTSSDKRDIQKALENYLFKLKKEGTPERFVKNGSTFFNNWHDWITVPKQETEFRHPAII